VGFCLHRPAPAFLDGIANRLLAQPALQAEPVFLSSSHGDSWDASRQVARHVARPISHPHDKKRKPQSTQAPSCTTFLHKAFSVFQHHLNFLNPTLLRKTNMVQRQKYTLINKYKKI
jgi:hypothetical protein